MDNGVMIHLHLKGMQTRRKEKKIHVKWNKRHIKRQNEPASDQDRMSQEVLLTDWTDHPDLVNMTVLSSFELICDELFDLLTEQTNIYDTREFFCI